MTQENNISIQREDICKNIQIPLPSELTFDNMFPYFDRRRIRRMPNGYLIFKKLLTQELNKESCTLQISEISSIAVIKWRELPDDVRLGYNNAARYFSEVY